jgi:hypothetical protein
MATSGYCSRCGTPRRAEDVFCGSCGTRLPDTSGGAPPAAGSSSSPRPAGPPRPPTSGLPPTTPIPVYQPPPGGGPPPPPVSWYPATHQQPPATGVTATGTGVATGVKIRPIPLIGGLAIAVSSLLPWIASAGGVPSGTAFDVPVEFLFDPQGFGDGLKLGAIVLLIGLAGGALSFTTRGPGIRRILASATIAIGGAYIAQLVRVVGQLPGASVADLIGFGVYVMIGGGILLLASK